MGKSMYRKGWTHKMKPANLMLFGMMLASLSQPGTGNTEQLTANSPPLLEAAESVQSDITQPTVFIDDEE